MLIYEKLVEAVRKLYASTTNIPSEEDTELTYKRSDGTEIELSRTALYYEKNKKLYMAKEGSKIPTDEDVEIGVFVGDKQIIGSIEVSESEDIEESTDEEAVKNQPTIEEKTPDSDVEE